MDGFLARRLNDPKFASGRVEAYASGPAPTLLYASQSLASKKEDDDKKPKKKSIKDAKKGDDLDGDGVTNEAKKKKVTDFSDRDGNGKPDAFEGGPNKKKMKKETDSSDSDSD